MKIQSRVFVKQYAPTSVSKVVQEFSRYVGMKHYLSSKGKYINWWIYHDIP